MRTWLLVLGLCVQSTAWANPEECPASAEDAVQALAASPTQASYLCVINNEAARVPLVERIQQEQGRDAPPTAAYSRALTLHLAARSQQAWDVDFVALLTPDDRRLLADAVKARRGRKSPSAKHDEIFQLQPWYTVRAGYTDNGLTQVEKDNIAMADSPELFRNRSPSVEPSVPTPEPAAAGAPQPSSGCGCVSGGAAGSLWLCMPLLLGGLRMRAFRDSIETASV